ncbi:MAG: PAS domain S-box protein [Desulfobacterales bacterium]|jgi:PAS domain S-box-containing protein
MVNRPQPKDKIPDPSGTTDDTKVQRERYRVFIEDVADGFYECNLRGDFKYFNNALCRIFGYPREELQGRNYRDFMDENNAKIAFDSFNKIFRTGRGITDIIWEIIRKDGQRRTLEISANIITDHNGEKTGFRGIARDFTEKHLARQKALESEKLAQCQYEASRRAEQRYQAFLKFLPDPVFVFNLDGTVSYLNPAFEKVFGWTLEELEGKKIPFVPDSHKAKTREGVKRLFKDKVLHGFETKRLTKDGRLLDIVIDGALFYDENNQLAGQVVTLRDISREKRMARSNQALFRIAKALYQFRGLDARLDFITKEVQDLMTAGGALVILIDPDKPEFFFRAAAYEDSEAEKKYKEVRFPLDRGVAGQVYRTGKPMIVADYYKSPYSFLEVDAQTGSKTQNMIQVPMWTEDRMIGVLCAVNKKEGQFDQSDSELLSTIASIVALPIVNARINEELQNSYEEVKSLNRAKDRVIHHLSHELKTPVSVLSASLGLLAKKLSPAEDKGAAKILERSQRNLKRLLDMQYEIEDILRQRDYQAYYLLSSLLDACADELEALVATGLGEEEAIESIRRRVEELFGPREARSEIIRLDDFVRDSLANLRPRFAHRKCRLETLIQPAAPIAIPPEVLSKIVEGLIRNAVENTPDNSRIEVSVGDGAEGPEFKVQDFGVGITEEKRRLIFENYFSPSDTMQYSTRNPFDFNAGGRGFDLLRMKIFSERYNFKIQMISNRCKYLPSEEDICPGKVGDCEPCHAKKECLGSGGTTVIVQFFPADRTRSIAE